MVLLALRQGYLPQNSGTAICNADTLEYLKFAAAPLSPPYCRDKAETPFPACRQILVSAL
jgi:hypothetical protein